MVVRADPDEALGGEPIEPDTILQGQRLRRSHGTEEGPESPIDTVKRPAKPLTEASEQLGEAAKKVEEHPRLGNAGRIHDVLDNAAESLKAIRGCSATRRTSSGWPRP